MVNVVKESTINAVIVEKDRTVSTVVSNPRVVEVEDKSLVTVVVDKPRVLTASTQGVQGPANPYTDEQIATAVHNVFALSVQAGDGVDILYDEEAGVLYANNTNKGTEAVVSHMLDIDPHPQYLDATESIDGGNF